MYLAVLTDGVYHARRIFDLAIKVLDHSTVSLVLYLHIHVITISSIATSIILCLKYASLFFTTLTATISCVFVFLHFTT